MENERSLPGFEDRAPADRYCDLVLTGGVTSAIAYPGVIHSLAQAYRFHAIGGSSSGAGSAALAAAAEYRRRHGSGDGFRTLLRRTAEVKLRVGGKTGLSWLFQPDADSQRLFNAVLRAFTGPKDRMGAFFLGVVQHYAAVLLTGFLLGAAYALVLGRIVGAQEWLGWGFAALLSGSVVGVGWLVKVMLGDLNRACDHDFGLCSGQQKLPGAPHEPLTPWLHDLLQDIAGLPPDRPLTFADLHQAPGGPRETWGDASPTGRRSIDLRMFASHVTLGKPLLLPLGEDDPVLYFKPQEMKRLFPASVVKAMMGTNNAPAFPEQDLWELPRETLPVVVAARMSVSFPVLFSAVPLWQRAPKTGGGLDFRRLLVVDGGLCSNFPIHLFDSPVPDWPTFGVSLLDSGGEFSLLPDEIAARVRVPADVFEPPADRASHLAGRPQAEDEGRPKAPPLERALGYAGAIFSTVKDWNDTLLAELPGVRERVAQVALPDNIGGLNILMDAEQIECLALLGGEVARQLLKRYAVPDGDGAQAPGWREHRWVRFNVLSECLQQTLVGLSRSAQFARYAQPMREQIHAATLRAPLRGPAGPATQPLQPAQAAALERLLDALQEIERALTPRAMTQPYKPLPRPELRIRPPL